MAEIIKQGNKTFLHFKQFLYLRRSNGTRGVVYWRCRGRNECSAALITVTDGGKISIREGGDANSHSHTPDPDEVAAVKLFANIKENASQNPEVPPERCLPALSGLHSAKMVQLSDCENIKKQIQRDRIKNMPSNPQNIEDLGELPGKYKTTAAAENFLLYDSREDEEYDSTCGRILVFAT